MSFFTRIGIHPNPNKHTSGLDLKVVSGIKKVRIPMNMQIGPGAKPCVAKGDKVKVGQMIGEPTAFMGVPVHASLSGTVTAVTQFVASNGRMSDIVEIESDRKMTVDESCVPHDPQTKEEFVQCVRDAGLVGLGGAGFPTHVKLSPPPDKTVDHLLVNAMECEPFITSDDWLLVHHADEILQGIAKVLKFCNIPAATICLEDNKPIGIWAVQEVLKKDPSLREKIALKIMKARYPLGAEKFLIEKALGRIVPSGGLPHDAGVLVMNVGTARYIEYYLKTGIPLVEKILTIDGSAVAIPGVYQVPVGASIADVIQLTGGFAAVPNKIIMGGPMMGIAVDTEDSPILKNNNAILCFDAKDSAIPTESPCIRCGRCVDVCPMGLMPSNLDKAARKANVETLQALSVMDCIECGSCTYICPAKRYLVQNIKLGKAQVRLASKK